jgi:hypothetical protein
MYRPMTPPEVRGRNNWIIEDIGHTGDLLQRFGDSAVRFVITNGYRGDYRTWPVALRRNVMIGTIDDIEDLAADPVAAGDMLKSRVGFDPAAPSPNHLSEICFKLKIGTSDLRSEPGPGALRDCCAHRRPPGAPNRDRYRVGRVTSALDGRKSPY